MTGRSPTDRGTVSVVIVTHQSEAFVGRVLDLLAADDDGPDEIIVVDNASTDSTRQIVEREGVRLVALDENIGFAGGCHAGVEASSGDTVVFIGHDTHPRPGWIPPLVAAVSDPHIGAAMATIDQADDPDAFNTSGGHLTYYGIAWVSDLGSPIPATEPQLVDVAFPSGAAMAIRRDTWDRFGGFRHSLFMYHEDTDLGWRLRLAGLRVVRASESRVGHDYDFSRTPAKMFWLERNRRILLATNYRTSTRVVLAPAFLAADVGVTIVAVRDGWITQKMKAWRDTWRSRSRWLPDRQVTASLRTIGDAPILETMDWSVTDITQVDTLKGSGVASGFFRLYLQAVLPIVRWFDRRAGFGS